MTSNNKQHGFSAVEVILVIVVIALLAFVAWSFFDARSEDNDTAQQASEQQIENSEDLADAEDLLLETDIDGELDTEELDESLSE